MWLLRKIRENRRFNELEERIEKLERGHRALDMEWQEYYDKIRHAMGRISKRSAIVESANEEEGVEADASLSEETSSFDDLIGLSPRAKQINNRILAARRRQTA